jgi:hypothetical protein
MTYGQIRLQLQKLLPGVDLELIDGWIQGRYTRILDLVSWKRQEAESVLAAPQTVNAGTLTATLGSNAITGLGTAWTVALNGLMIRINNTSEYYQFTYVGATSATLDRPFEGPTAAALAYRIDQHIYVLPSNCRIVRQVTPLHVRAKPLEQVSPADLNRISASRNVYGTPKYWAQTWDSFSDPPQLQLELFPVPDCPDGSGNVLSWSVGYIFDQGDLDPDATSITLMPFVKPWAIIEGVKADAMRPRPGWTGDLAAAQAYEVEFEKACQESLMINAQQRGGQVIRLAPHLRRQPSPTRRLSTPWDRGIPPGGWD